jgi:RNA polymerase sigma-70 factor (ECF subfamily)
MEKPVHTSALPATDEADLVRTAQDQPSAFALIYQAYLARVYNYLRARLETDEDAADLTQQVFLQAFNALPTYQARGAPFAAWLFQIARHAAVDAHRRRRDAISWDALPVAFHPLTDDQDMDTHLLQQERLALLRRLLAELSPLERELLALRFAAGLTTPQIALVVGKSHAAVKKQLTRLLQTLKEQSHE